MQPSGIGQSEAILNSQFVALVQVKDRRVVWCNQAFATLFGYPLEELINQPTRQFFPDDESHVAFGQAISTELARASLFHTVVRQRRKSGEICWFEFNCSYLAGSSDTIVGALVDRTANYQLEQALKLNAEILANIKDAVVMTSKDHVIRYTNRAFEVMFGYAEGELIGQNIAIINAKAVRSPEEIVAEIVDFLKAHGYWQGNVLNQRKDGSTFWTEASVTTHESPDWGTVWISVQRDITEQLKVQTTLRASEERYRSLVVDSSDLSWTVPPSGFQVIPQARWMAFTGQTAEEMLGEGWARALHPDDAAAIAAGWEVAVERGEPFESQYRLRRHDGAWRWISARTVPIRDDRGQVIEWAGMGHDITAQKEIEINLRESEQRLELALSCSGLALWEWDIAGHTVVAGPQWHDMLGYQPSEMGKSEDDWLGLIHPNDLKLFERKMSAHVQGETAIFQSEYRLRHKDGHWVTVAATGKVTLRDNTGRAQRMIGTVLNVSQLKRLNDEGVELLKQIEAMIRDTTSGTAHANDDADATERLSRRQQQTLVMIARGMTSAEIASQLKISTGTAISHRRALMKKLGLHSAADVVRFAVRHKLIKG